MSFMILPKYIPQGVQKKQLSRHNLSTFSTPRTTSTNFFNFTSKRTFRTTGVQRANPQKKIQEDEEDEEEENEEEAEAELIRFTKDGIKMQPPTILRPYDSQFFSLFPSLLTKRRPKPDPVIDITLKQLEEVSADFDKRYNQEFFPEKFVEVDETARSFSVEEIAVVSGTNVVLSPQIIEKYLPDGWSPKNKISIEFEKMEEVNIYARKWLYDIIDMIEDQKSKNFLKSKGCKTVLATGFHGIGISTMLSLLAIYGRANGWIVLNISGAKITQEEQIDPNRILKNRYDQNVISLSLIDSLLQCNRDQLSQIPLRTPVPTHLVNEGLEVKKEMSLADVCEFALKNDEESATDTFCYIRRELNLVTEFPVLIVVDEYNMLFNPSFYPDMHSTSYAQKRLEPAKLNLVRCFNDPLNTGLVNGVMVCGTTGAFPRKESVKRFQTLLYHVPPLHFSETLSRVKYYQSREFMEEGLPNESIKFMHEISGGSFLELVKYVDYASSD